MEVDGITEELDKQKEENRLQHEQIVSLTAKLAETELRLAQLMAEHDEVGATLLITRDNQNTLANELAEFKDRYAEVCSHDEIRLSNCRSLTFFLERKKKRNTNIALIQHFCFAMVFNYIDTLIATTIIGDCKYFLYH